MPLSEGKNPTLSIAKFAARIALFDSQTIPIKLPEAVLWGECLLHLRFRTDISDFKL